jgi:hypothetical protein
MVCKNFNGVIDEMSALITFRIKTTKPGENELIYKFHNHRHYIDAQCLCFHPLNGIVGYYQNILISSRFVDWFD